ncbi:hypothetical protein NBRC3280_2859 [Acetobacter pasteurianus NBRC 3280]|nr:hypothetical protein [Acetobacter pasteurianus]GCD60209.1 hypothetical protein NBRC3277_2784 [Acetobacter pasteurianus NBRC 3277]GCD70224.1 hypothetical protein NBRC3280_2859 [Acetobacter pasteurianus NBRC 3280]
MFLYHGSPDRNLFQDEFTVTAKESSRLQAFFTSTDPGVAALYAGPDGVVYRFNADQTSMRSGYDKQIILDGRWNPDSTAHNCPISDDQYLLIEKYLLNNQIIKEGDYIDLCSENFYYGSMQPADQNTWLRVIHDDFLPAEMPASKREAVAGELLKLCGYTAVVGYDSSDGMENDFTKRYSESNWSDAARLGCKKVLQGIQRDPVDYDWTPVVAFMNGTKPNLKICGRKQASLILEQISGSKTDYRVCREFPNWIEPEKIVTPASSLSMSDRAPAY